MKIVEALYLRVTIVNRRILWLRIKDLYSIIIVLIMMVGVLTSASDGASLQKLQIHVGNIHIIEINS